MGKVVGLDGGEYVSQETMERLFIEDSLKSLEIIKKKVEDGEISSLLILGAPVAKGVPYTIHVDENPERPGELLYAMELAKSEIVFGVLSDNTEADAGDDE